MLWPYYMHLRILRIADLGSCSQPHHLSRVPIEGASVLPFFTVRSIMTADFASSPQESREVDTSRHGIVVFFQNSFKGIDRLSFITDALRLHNTSIEKCGIFRGISTHNVQALGGWRGQLTNVLQMMTYLPNPESPLLRPTLYIRYRVTGSSRPLSGTSRYTSRAAV